MRCPWLDCRPLSQNLRVTIGVVGGQERGVSSTWSNLPVVQEAPQGTKSNAPKQPEPRTLSFCTEPRSAPNSFSCAESPTLKPKPETLSRLPIRT